MNDYSNESIQYDCFRGCTIVTDEETGENDIRYLLKMAAAFLSFTTKAATIPPWKLRDSI